MRKSEEMPFALLRASLHEKETETLFFVGATETDWDKCFLLAKKQGVMALAWDGVLKLPNSLHPDMEFKLQWGIKVEHLERKYQRYCKVAHEITKLYKQPFPKSKLGIVVYKVRRFIYTQKLKREIFNNSLAECVLFYRFPPTSFNNSPKLSTKKSAPAFINSSRVPFP